MEMLTNTQAEEAGLVRVACTSNPGSFETGIQPSHYTCHSAPFSSFRVYWATPEAVEAAGWVWREGIPEASEHLKRCRIALYRRESHHGQNGG